MDTVKFLDETDSGEFTEVSTDSPVTLLSVDPIVVSVSTQDPLNNNFKIEASSHLGLNKAELSLSIFVCGSEEITIEKDFLSLVNSKSESLGYISNFKNFFSNSNANDCPISSYKLIYTNSSEEYIGSLFFLDLDKY